ncbi:MAG: glutathione S-transferase family protein, partial [Pseudolabrys sp.]
VVSWMSYAASTLHPARARGPERAKAIFAAADRRLGESEWAAGRYSIADIHLFRIFWRFHGAAKPAPEEFPNLTAHYARMMARDAVRRAIAAETAAGYELPA